MLRIECFSVVSLAPDDLGLLDIIRECDVLNREQIVTGFLHYDGKNFRQVMEGPENVLTPMFEALRRDLRHEDVRVLSHSLIETRQHAGFLFRYMASVNQPVPKREPAKFLGLVENCYPKSVGTIRS